MTALVIVLVLIAIFSRDIFNKTGSKYEMSKDYNEEHIRDPIIIHAVIEPWAPFEVSMSDLAFSNSNSEFMILEAKKNELPVKEFIIDDRVYQIITMDVADFLKKELRGKGIPIRTQDEIIINTKQHMFDTCARNQVKKRKP